MDKVYKQSEGYTCGPAAYMESFRKGRKSKSVEMSLHESGRVNPSRIFLGPSFLKVDPSLNLYTTNLGVTEGIFGLIHNPHIPGFREQISKNYAEMINSGRDRVYRIKGIASVRDILNQMINRNGKALLLTHSGHWLPEGAPHWVSVLGKNDNYRIGDPYTGQILELSESDLERTLQMLKGIDFPLQVVTNFKAKK